MNWNYDISAMPAYGHSWVEVASTLWQVGQFAMSLIGRLKRLSERVDRMADPDDPTYDPPDRAITRAEDRSQAVRDDADEPSRDG
jgi:hypothetical protein